MKELIAACMLWAASTAASAGVVYTWQTLTTSDTISSAVGRIEISNAAYLAGGASYNGHPDCTYYDEACAANPSSPVISFYFRVNSSTPTPADIDLNLVQGTGVMYPVENWFAASFTLDGAYLNLDMSANTGETDMRMAGNTVTRFGSDAPYFGDDCFSPGCSGASGQWVRMMQAQRVTQVPEPGTLLLLGIGIIATALGKRRA